MKKRITKRNIIGLSPIFLFAPIVQAEIQDSQPAVRDIVGQDGAKKTAGLFDDHGIEDAQRESDKDLHAVKGRHGKGKEFEAYMGKGENDGSKNTRR